MRRSVLAIAFAALCVASSSAVAQQATQTAGKPAQAAAQSVILAINGTPAERASLVRSAFSTKALQNEGSDTRLKWLNKLAADSHGLAVLSSMPQGERMVEAIVKTDTGGKFGKLVLFTSKTEPGKISDLFLLPARDPAKVKVEAWPKNKLTLPQIAAEIDKRARILASEDSFAGAVLVAKGNRIVLKRAYGLADQEWRIPNRTDTAFHIASIGKMFTAAAIVKLAAEGKLSVDDTLAKWVPEYPHPEAAQITLKQLLTHSAGIGDWDGRTDRREKSGAEAAQTMTAALQFKPGAHFSYSNAGYVLLQAVIEKATGKTFAEALDELVFKPSGMTRTGPWPVTAIVPNRATGYLHREDDPLGLGPRFSNEQFLGYGGDGSGGEYSTADDMFRFLSAVSSGKLLGKAGTRAILTPRIDFEGAPRPSKYGYGMDLTTCGGHPLFGHEGGGEHSGVSSLAYRTLDGDWTIVVLSNYDPPAAGDLTFAICEFVAGR
ncbi:MAG: serine hydrolase domain-containing protein [Sphingomicrobium sp.]